MTLEQGSFMGPGTVPLSPKPCSGVSQAVLSYFHLTDTESLPNVSCTRCLLQHILLGTLVLLSKTVRATTKVRTLGYLAE